MIITFYLNADTVVQGDTLAVLWDCWTTYLKTDMVSPDLYKSWLIISCPK